MNFILGNIFFKVELLFKILLKMKHWYG